jgi:hypothetical protein
MQFNQIKNKKMQGIEHVESILQEVPFTNPLSPLYIQMGMNASPARQWLDKKQLPTTDIYNLWFLSRYNITMNPNPLQP